MTEMKAYKSISDKLKKKLDKSYRVTYMPDHPLLMDGPEIMIGGQGRLTCVVTDTEIKSVERLRAKLTLCRLALPENARIILSTKNENIAKLLDNDYDYILDPEGLNESLESYVISLTKPKTAANDIKESKRLHQILYSKLFFFSQQRIKYFDKKSEVKNIINSVSRSKTTFSWYENISKFELTKSHTKRQISNHCLNTINDNVHLDNGTPYLNNKNYYKVVLSDFLPTSRFDPNKPLRALAFTGQALTDAESEFDLNEIMEKIDYLINKQRVWELPK